MAIQSQLRGVSYPDFLLESTSASILSGLTALNAAGHKAAFVGRLVIDGRATNKTLSAAGGGSIVHRIHSLTWADGSTALSVGLQGVDLTTGNPVRPSGSFDVSRSLVPGVDALSTGMNSISMTGGSGSKTLSHGDWVAIVFDMTARAGSDAVAIGVVQYGAVNTSPPLLNTGSWSGISNMYALVGIIFDDGTRAVLDGSMPLLVSQTAENFSDATNPDERGMSFEVPWDCKIDAIHGMFAGTAAAGDFELQIYQDPFGTPTSILPGGTALAVNAEMLRSYVAQRSIWPLVGEIALTRNTRYAVTMKALGASNSTIGLACTLENAAWKKFWFGGENASKVTRNNGSGAFTETTDVIYQMSVRISGFVDTDGGGGGGGSRQKVYGG